VTANGQLLKRCPFWPQKNGRKRQNGLDFPALLICDNRPFLFKGKASKNINVLLDGTGQVENLFFIYKAKNMEQKLLKMMIF